MSENINYGAETVEEYAELLNTPVEIPRTSKRVFKGANIEKIDALLRDPVMIDLEKLGFNGDLDDEALLDYCIQLPEFRDVCRRFDEALAETFAFMKKTIPSVVKKSFQSNGAFCDAGLTALYDEIFRLAAAFASIKTASRFRLNRIKAFINTMCTLLNYEIIQEVARLPHAKNPATQRAVGHFLDFLRNKLKRVFPNALPGITTSIAGQKINECNRTHRDSYQAVLGVCTEDEQDLAESAQTKFELFIDTYGQYEMKKYVKKIGPARIEIFGLNMPTSAIEISFVFKVVLDPDDNNDHQLRLDDHQGRGHIVTFKTEKGYYDLSFDVLTGEIYVGDTISLSQFIPRKDYLRLKNVVLDAALEYLEQLELNGEFKHADTEPCPLVTSQEVAAEVIDLMENEPDVPDTPKKSKRVVSLKNRKGRRVLQALKKILGPPKNNESTHFTFQGRTGKTYPIAIHPGKDVGEGLLHTCLVNYGIEREEFDDAY